MTDQKTVEEIDETTVSRPPLLLSSTNQRASQSRLLTKLYYPDTLYPDNYSFFADRGDTTSTSHIKSSTAMESNEQYSSTEAPTMPRSGTTEIEPVDRHTKYPVSSNSISFCFRDLIFKQQQ